MKYIKTYNESNQDYGFPKSLNPLLNYLNDFISNKFDWWMMRKSLANYQEVLYFDKFDLEEFISTDFPIEVLELRLWIKVGTKIPSGISAGARRFTNKRNQNNNSKIYYNRAKPIIEVKINIDPNKQDYEYVKSEILGYLKHELVHIYQGYKHIKHNKDFKSFNYRLSNIINHIIDICPDRNIATILCVYYIFTNKFEVDAHASHIIKDDGVYRNIKYVNNLDTLSYDKELVDKLFKEFIEYYNDVKDEMPKNEIIYINKLISKDADYFINSIYNYTKSSITKFLKKIHKKLT